MELIVNFVLDILIKFKLEMLIKFKFKVVLFSIKKNTSHETLSLISKCTEVCEESCTSAK